MGKKLSFGDKWADWIAEQSGSWRFIIYSILINIIWVVYNTFVVHPFDPYPHQLLNLFISELSYYVPLFILMSQNRATIQDKKRDQAIYRLEQATNQLTEEINGKIDKLLRKIGD